MTAAEKPMETDLPVLKQLYRYLCEQGQFEFAAEVDDAFREIRGLREEVERLREELSIALRMFAKKVLGPPFDKPPEYYVAFGREKAGLRAAPDPGPGEPGGVEGAGRDDEHAQRETHAS